LTTQPAGTLTIECPDDSWTIRAYLPVRLRDIRDAGIRLVEVESNIVHTISNNDAVLDEPGLFRIAIETEWVERGDELREDSWYDIEIFDEVFDEWQSCADEKQQNDIALLFVNLVSHEDFERFSDEVERLRVDTQRFVESLPRDDEEPPAWSDEW
jgi:hypothetical protein